MPISFFRADFALQRVAASATNTDGIGDPRSNRKRQAVIANAASIDRCFRHRPIRATIREISWAKLLPIQIRAGNRMNHRENSFDLMRHAAALMVLFSHHFALAGRPEPLVPIAGGSFGYFAVSIFFAISGFLMPQSFTNSKDFVEFMRRRCRRIFPGLIVCSFVMIYVIGLFFTPRQALDYVSDEGTFRNFLMTSTFFVRNIPEVFTSFVYPNAVNGSLWTLPIEFACYIIIGVALSFSNSVRSLLALLVISVISTITINRIGLDSGFFSVPYRYLGPFGIAFAFGALLSKTVGLWIPYRWYLTLASIVFLYVFQENIETVFNAFCVTFLTIAVGTGLKDRLIKGRFDFSYGIYIYAFPIQQIVINRITHSFWQSMAVSAALTLIAGFLSYWLIESPFLRRTRARPARVDA